MKLPKVPPSFEDIMQDVVANARLQELLQLISNLRTQSGYLHWDEVRRRPGPNGFSQEEWWLALKMIRRASYRSVPLLDTDGQPFNYYVMDTVQELLHKIDAGAGGFIGASDPVSDVQTRDRYIVSSLIEESITSSQLEGAAATRDVAKEMLKTGRRPQDSGEQMILNNFITMRHIMDIKDEPLTPDLVFEIHRLVTDSTLDTPDASGRLRSEDESIHIVDRLEGTVYHTPPPPSELEDRLRRLCDFANGVTPDAFVHPVVRAIILHFWLAYDHPFVDGNGRTARALFYWAMLKHGYWLFQFVSISRILVKARVKYERSFLYTETDDNDLNYFIIYQASVISRAIKELHAYIDRKQNEVRAAEAHLHGLRTLNHRQEALILHALKHPDYQYTIESHRCSHASAYATARADLLDLQARGLLARSKRGKAMVFSVEPGLAGKLKTLASRPNGGLASTS